MKALLESMRGDGLVLSPRDSGKIRVHGPAAAVGRWAGEIKARKTELLSLLLGETGVPREWADGCARLSTMLPPADVSEDRWQLFIDDCGRFLDKWAGRAAQVGWKPADLFGVCRSGPSKRVDLAGVLWLLEGREIAAIDRHGIAIRCASGVIQTYRPARSSVERILAWELPPVLDAGGRWEAERLLDDYPLDAA